MKVLIIAEHDNKILKPANQNVMTAALELSSDVDMLILGNHFENVVSQASKLSLKTIIAASHSDYEHQLAENTATLITDLAKNYDYVIAPATTFGKNVLPRVAALLDTSMISDVMKINDKNNFVRPIYAGNALATVESNEKIKILTIRTTGFAACKLDNTSEVAVTKLEKVISNNLSKFVNHELTVSARPELTSARIVISGGRAFKSAENFKLLEKIADDLGAALGASRAAVDAGFAPNDYQVGQTGKVVAPDLYIAIGISGAIQHLAGMKDSKVIVAINNDPDAPIFQIADYGLVGDLFKILPELEEELSKMMA